MPLTPADIKKFKARLEEMRDQIQNNLRSASEDVRSSSEEGKGLSQHQADEGTDDFGRTITIEVSSTEQNLLVQIERALKKIDDGTYGVCDISGKDIPKKRLDAIPYATMTVEAQEQVEKGHVFLDEA